MAQYGRSRGAGCMAINALLLIDGAISCEDLSCACFGS